MNIRPLLWLALVPLLSPLQVSAACVCDTSTLNAIIRSQVLPVLKDIRSELKSANNKLDELIAQSKQIQADTNQTRSAIAELTSQSQALSDHQVYESVNTAQKQSAADSDVSAVKSTIGSRHPYACEMARNSESVSRGGYTQAHASRTLSYKAREDINRVTNPVKEVKRVLDLNDRDLVPEFAGGYSGTMDEEQVESYMNFVSVLMPTPPRAPAALPDRFKTRPKAREYEAEFRKYEATQLFYSKPFLREAMLMYPSIEADAETQRIWEQITAGVPKDQQLVKSGEDGVSNFPDHWNALNYVQRGGRDYISELDYLRFEVFKRYRNPHYQSDPKYGLASMGTTEALLKELIAVENLQARMLYEIMSANLHSKQTASVGNAWESADKARSRLGALESELLRD